MRNLFHVKAVDSDGKEYYWGGDGWVSPFQMRQSMSESDAHKTVRCTHAQHRHLDPDERMTAEVIQEEE